MREAQKHDANVFLPGSLGPVRRTVVLECDYDNLRAELAALKVARGEPAAFFWQFVDRDGRDGPYFGAPTAEAIGRVGPLVYPVLLYTAPPAAGEAVTYPSILSLKQSILKIMNHYGITNGDYMARELHRLLNATEPT